MTISPFLQDGEIRIVLTWGRNPRDLDSHLTVPLSGGGSSHLAYYNMSVYDNGVLVAFLDVDDVDSYGPETITIYHSPPGGVFTYFVHDFTNRDRASSTALANSGANVKVYFGNNSMREFNVPPGIVGDTWYVFTLIDGEITSISS